MKKAIHFFAVASLILTFHSSLFSSASAQKSNWSFFLGGSYAIGDFGDVDIKNNDWALISPNSTKGGAGLGFDLGISYLKPLGNGKTSLLLGVDFLYSFVNTSVRNNIRNLQVEASNVFQKAEFTNPSFMNMPILAGLHHEESIGGNFKAYFEAQLGIALRWINDRSGELRGASAPFTIGPWDNLTDYSYTDHFYSTPGLAFRIAVGMVMEEHWLVDFGFLYLGKFNLEGYEDYEITTAAAYLTPSVTSNGSAGFSAGTINPLMLVLRLGYRL